MVHSGRFLSNWKKEQLVQMTTCCPSLPFVVTRCHFLSLVLIRCQPLPFVVTRCHSLSLVVICCHSLSLVVPLVVTGCNARGHSFSLVVIRCHSLYHLLSLVVTRCITRLSFCKRLFCNYVLRSKNGAHGSYLLLFTRLFLWYLIFINHIR